MVKIEAIAACQVEFLLARR